MVVGGYTLTQDQEDKWKAAYPDEYARYVNEGWYDELTNTLLVVPEWMDNEDLSDGPFDFAVNSSHEEIGW